MSGEVKHTPGPWRIKGTSADWMRILGPDGQWTDSGRDRDVLLANATLKAAAPELLEACQQMIAIWNSGYEPAMAAKQQMQAAIAKAKGLAE